MVGIDGVRAAINEACSLTGEAVTAFDSAIADLEQAAGELSATVRASARSDGESAVAAIQQTIELLKQAKQAALAATHNATTYSATI
ncbi:hypothetical protein [Actinokineospora sp. NPDC004072]